jgi:hypothetical protein
MTEDFCGSSATASCGRAAPRRRRRYSANRRRASRRGHRPSEPSSRNAEKTGEILDISAVVPLLIAEASTRRLQALAASDPDILVW